MCWNVKREQKIQIQWSTLQWVCATQTCVKLGLQFYPTSAQRQKVYAGKNFSFNVTKEWIDTTSDQIV